MAYDPERKCQGSRPGLGQKECYRLHVLPAVGPPGRGSYRCPNPDHPDRKPSFSINPGSFVRMVWNCEAGCDPAVIREALLVRGIHESCLGVLGTARRPPAPGMPSGLVRADPATVAEAKRMAAVRKLPADLPGALYRVCVQAISEGDGDLPPDPERLLPVDYAGLVDLAARAGIGRANRYKLAADWFNPQNPRKP